MSTDKRTAAVIVAAGKGRRMGGNIPKQYLELAGKPVLCHTLDAFQASRTDDIIIVCPTGDEDFVRDSIVNTGGYSKVKAVVPGGAERFDSCSRGIDAVTSLEHADYVLVHDGVRALVEPELINKVIDGLEAADAIVPAVPVKDTIRVVDETGVSKGVLNRETLRAVQTPQGFKYDVIRKAYALFGEDVAAGRAPHDITDDAMLVERYLGCTVTFTEGSDRNIKITTPEDISYAEVILC